MTMDMFLPIRQIVPDESIFLDYQRFAILWTVSPEFVFPEYSRFSIQPTVSVEFEYFEAKYLFCAQNQFVAIRQTLSAEFEGGN
jgi:hypothetical protein